MSIRTYSELMRLITYDERVAYLQSTNMVGEETLGAYRMLCQRFYRSSEWKRIRDIVIVRDGGCDLGCEDRPLFGNEQVYVHHIESITVYDLLNHTDKLTNPDNLICCSRLTHNYIHYGSGEIPNGLPVERRPGDTKLW